MKAGDPFASGSGRGDDSALAAEYAMGLLDIAEAQNFEDRMTRDPTLCALYAGWCESLVQMVEGPDIEAPARVKSMIDRRLFGHRSLVEQFGRWVLGALLGAGAAAAVLIVTMVYILPALNQTELHAELEGEANVSASARYDSRTQQLAAAQTEGAPQVGRDYELWLFLAGEIPVSLGVFDAGGRLVADLSVVPMGVLMGATLAISEEPDRGSPTGAPTGEMLASGALAAP